MKWPHICSAIVYWRSRDLMLVWTRRAKQYQVGALEYLDLWWIQLEPNHSQSLIGDDTSSLHADILFEKMSV